MIYLLKYSVADYDVFMMHHYKKLLFFLLVIPGILPEILSGNTPIVKLLNPLDFFFLVLAYGVPIVLIWDFKTRYALSYVGIYTIGLAYGIFNEGLLAKTLLSGSSVPLGGFPGYGVVSGLNLSWSLMILSWHAFYSVLFPIAFAELIFPGEKNTILVGKKWTYFWIFLCFFLLVVVGKEWQGSISPGLYMLFYTISALLICLSTYFIHTPSEKVVMMSSVKSYVIGFAMIVLYLFFFLAAGKMPFLIYTIIGGVGLYLFLRYISRINTYNLCSLGVGSYLGFGGFSTLATLVSGRGDLFIMYIVLLGALHYFILYKNR